jgi:hypothetical protein
MSIVNPYEPSQLAALSPRAETLPEELGERERRVFGTRGQTLAFGARSWLLGLLVHHAFALAGYSMYVVDWAKGERTFYRHLGFGILIIGIVISLFITMAGQLRLCRWPKTFDARWWFLAAFLCFFGVLVLSISDLMLTLKYRENRDPQLWQLIEVERPTLLLSRFAYHLVLAIGLWQVGRQLQEPLLERWAGRAGVGAVLLAAGEGYFELLGSPTQILREVTYLGPIQQALIIGAWLLLTVSLVIAMYRFFRLAQRVEQLTPAAAVEDPFAD